MIMKLSELHHLFILFVFLFCFSGKHSTNFVSRYDPRFNSWIQLPPMQERFVSFSLKETGLEKLQKVNVT